MDMKIFTLSSILLAISVQSACLAQFPDNSDNFALSLVAGLVLSDSPEFAGIRVSRSTPQAFTNATPESPLFDQRDFASGTFANVTTLNSLPIPRQDVYFLNGGVDFQANNTGDRAIQFLAPAILPGGQIGSAVVGAPTAHSIGLLRQLSSSANINLQTRQGSGGALSTATDPTTTLGLVRFNRAVGSAAIVRKTAPQPIPNNALTAATFQVADYDTGNYYSAAQQDRLTIPETGVYLIVGNARLAATGSASGRGVEIFINGSTAIARDVRIAGATAAAAQDVSAVYRLNAGDTVAMRYYHNGGGSHNLLANLTMMAIARLDANAPSTRNVLLRRAAVTIPSVATGANTPLALSTVQRVDSAYVIANPANTTIVQSGLYLIVGNVQFANTGFARRNLELKVNAAAVAVETRNAGPGGHGALNVVHMRQLNAGDTVQISVIQNTGGNLGLVAAGCFLQMIKLD
ncbi:MAG: hypothetical protein NXI24_10560 [bacterium]|nr:hypothetical protein [bacterium]